MAIKAEEIIRLFYKALNEKWGYIYGATHEMWSKEKQAAYKREWAGDPDRANSCEYGGKWVGHWVTDCSGLFKWAFRQLGGNIAHGSNSVWDGYLASRGTLEGGTRSDGKPLLPGTAVFTTTGSRHNHIGLYVGDGNVIEAQGAQAGVVCSKITNSKWTAWGELKNVQYEDKGEEETAMATVVLPKGASGSTVNVRQRPSKSAALIGRVPVGASVDVTDDQGDWCRIKYGDLDGYMMSNYLEYDDQEGESGGAVITEADKLTIMAALTEIDRQLEIVRSAIGRG